MLKQRFSNHNLVLAIFISFISVSANAQKHEWDKFPLPIIDDNNKEWKLNPQSDDFNYEFKAVNRLSEFAGKWRNYYPSRWTGPAPTVWQHDHAEVSGGFLRITTTRPVNVETKHTVSGNVTKELNATYSGCISSLALVRYPVYVEAMAKISNSTMASDVWMLSPDATQEIDIIEAYGGDRINGENARKFYGPDRIHLSHHIFIRKPFCDYQPQDPSTWYKDGKGTIWRNNFHRVGVYWKDAYHLEYYIDGKPVRKVEGKEIIDPKNYSDNSGLVKGMNIIINMEDQSWRAIAGMSPSAEELKDANNSTFVVDWIRVYDLVDKKK
nr:beta-agarase [uncultured bacterium]